MTTFFAGGGFDCWVAPLSGASDYAGGVVVDPGGDDSKYPSVYAPLIDPATGAPTTALDLWFHAFTYGNSGPDLRNGIVQFVDTAGVAWARLSGGPGANVYMDWYDGTTWHQTGVGTPPMAFGGTIDLHVRIGVNGYIGWYYNGVLGAELVNVDTSAMHPIAGVRCFSATRFGQHYEGTVIASYNTIGHTVRRRGPTGNGPEQQWTGDYTSLNKDATNDNTAITANAAGLVSTFTDAPLSPTVAGSVIKSVVFGMRLRANGGTPAHASAVMTIGGTDYLSPAVAGSGGFTASHVAFDVDPSTSAAWASVDQVNGAFGVKAVA